MNDYIRTMKILVYGINYSPELTGIGKYTGEMCEWLAARGHDVEVITSTPYYPEWEIHSKYKKKWWHKEIINHVKVFRCPLYVPKKVKAKSRIIHELSFVVNSSVFWLPRFFKNYDVVIGICPPLQAGIFPWLYKVVRGRPCVFHIQDLQVDAAKELGLIKNKLLLRFLEKTEKFLLQKSTRVSSISEGMKKKLLYKGLQEKKYISLPNWVDTDFIKPLSGDIPLKAELGFKKTDKIILYSGSMGEKQGLEIVISIAEKLKNDASLFFVFSGEGPAKKKLESLVKEKGLFNVRFFNLQPYERLPELLCMADLNLVLQKKAATDIVLPSKLMTILSAGRASIVTASPGSSLYDLIKKNNIGILAEPENEEDLLEIIKENIGLDNNLLKNNARNYAIKELNIHKVLCDFELTLSEL